MLMVLGASHHDLELTQLDRLAIHPTLLSRAVGDLARRPDGPIDGAVVVSTCNRLEIYLDAVRFHDAIDGVAEQLAQVTGLGAAEVSTMLKVRVGAPAVAHLFTVASGLDSMVVGEAEIAGQVARALREAQTTGTASPAINQLFQNAARVAKQVATETGLGAAGRSVASVALDIAGVGPTGAGVETALIIGTGAYARVVAAELRARGVEHLLVHSPTGRADTFAQRHAATQVDADALVGTMARVDLVVACSGQSAGMLDEPMLAAAVARRNTPLPIIDLALHPHVAGPARLVPGVRVVDLHTVQDEVDPAHLDAVVSAQDIVIAGVAAFEERMAIRRLDPAVVALRQHISGTVEKELGRLRAKYPADVAADMERALHRVTQALLHTPTLRAQELARTGDGAGYVQALHTLFGIDIHDSETAAHPITALRTS
jgi:glutamyl-tRNA reductase